MTFSTREKPLADLRRAAAEAAPRSPPPPTPTWPTPWKFSFGDHVISNSPRSLAFRHMFFNHLIHHRAQLGVYLRLNDVPVPGLYGPSADEPFKP